MIDERVWSVAGMIQTGEVKHLERNLPLYHLVHHMSHMDCPNIKPGPLQWEGSNCLNHGTFILKWKWAGEAIYFIVIIINIKDWTLWSVPSPELRLLSSNVSSVFQFFSFLLVCSDMILKGFSLVAFFASVKASSICIYLSCPVCIQSVVVCSLFCGHKGCSRPQVSVTAFLPLQFFVSVRLSESNFYFIK